MIKRWKVFLGACCIALLMPSCKPLELFSSGTQEFIEGGPIVAASSPGTVLIQLGVEGITVSGGTTSSANRLVKTSADGKVDASLLSLSNPSTLLKLDNILYIDFATGTNATGNGAASSPVKTLEYAISQVTNSAVYVFTPGVHTTATALVSGDELKMPLTLIGLDPDNTTLAGQIISESMTTNLEINIYGLLVNTVLQDLNWDMSIGLFDRGGLHTLTHTITTTVATITLDGSEQAFPTASVSWITSVNLLDTHYYTETELDAGQLNSQYYTTNQLATGQLDSQYYTTNQLATGQLDVRYYTETELNAGQLDNRYYTTNQLATGQLDIIYYTETELNAGQLDSQYYTTNQLATGQLNSQYYTTNQLATGQLDTRYYTETELNAGQLDTRYYTTNQSDAKYPIIVTAPTSSAAAGAAGQIAFSNTNFYFYNAASSAWHRLQGVCCW